MSTNSDNAMARFLFAILKQKNLKDIDWSQVAKDPVLLQPISNGHAARMRYARFRSTVTDAKSKKRLRHGATDRVTKPSASKKSPKIKTESVAGPSAFPQCSPVSPASPYVGHGDDSTEARFLTPCSDDLTQNLLAAAARNPPQVDFNAFASTTGVDDDAFTSTGVFMPSPAFSTFDAAFDMSNYNVQPADARLTDPEGEQSTECMPLGSDQFYEAQFLQYP